MVVLQILESTYQLVSEMAPSFVSFFLDRSMDFSMDWIYFGSMRTSASSLSPHLGFVMLDHNIYFDRVSNYGFLSAMWCHSNQWFGELCFIGRDGLDWCFLAAMAMHPPEIML